MLFFFLVNCVPPAVKYTLADGKNIRCYSKVATTGTRKHFGNNDDKCPAGSYVACPESFMDDAPFNQYLVTMLSIGMLNSI